MSTHQTAGSRKNKRGDHVWWWDRAMQHFKCVTCGAITKDIPPNHPTPTDWLPERYERLTDDERAKEPYTGTPV